jgi:RNA polymerase sigma factor (sigma-70 family)
MKLNDAYETYLNDPDGWKEQFGYELLKYCQRYFYKNVGDVAGVSAKSSAQTMEDTLGDAILEIWERLPKFDPKKASFTTWVTIILANNFKDGYKKHSEQAEVLLMNEAQVHPHRSMDEKLTMKQAIKTLSAQEQEFLKLKFAGYSNEAIAEHFGKTVPWAKTTYFRMINRMKLFVSQKG